MTTIPAEDFDPLADISSEVKPLIEYPIDPGIIGPVRSPYKGLIVCCIKIDKPVQSLKDGDVVRFSETRNGVGSGKPVFLTDIETQRIPGLNRYPALYLRSYKAKFVSTSRAVAMATAGGRTPLFHVHGWTSETSVTINQTNKGMAFLNKSKLYPVPVMWPTIRAPPPGLVHYKDDQKNWSKDAGILFNGFAEEMEAFPKKYLMGHSMGNNFIVNGACSQKLRMKFKAIFMVAADVPFDMFSERPNGDENFKDYKKKATNLVDALANGGKVYVIHRDDDETLQVSSTAPNLGVKRIGLDGADSIRRDLSGKVKNVDVKGYNPSASSNHIYQYDKWCIEKYAELGN